MKIGVVGLGYVGTTSAACLAADGHEIWGMDVNARKLAVFNEGRSPVVEPGLGELLAQAHSDGLIHTAFAITPDLIAALDMFLICVGTPKRGDGQLDTTPLLNALHAIAGELQHRPAGARRLLIVIRSTLQPGSFEQLILPAMAQATDAQPGTVYELVYNPEFLREATALADYHAPPKIVVGERESGASEQLFGLYSNIEAPFFATTYANAEMVKLADNAFHAAKVTFGNEIGRLCHANGADAQAVMDMLLADTKLNISPAYLRPGGPYGGSCLPKDVSALVSYAQSQSMSVPMIDSLANSNLIHLTHLTERVYALAPQGATLLLIGMSFKTGTDDLRQSPLVNLAEALVRSGYDVRIFDPDVEPDRLLGENFALAAEHGELLGRKYADPKAAIANVDLVIIGKRVAEIEPYLIANTPILDIDRLQ